MGSGVVGEEASPVTSLQESEYLSEYIYRELTDHSATLNSVTQSQAPVVDYLFESFLLGRFRGAPSGATALRKQSRQDAGHERRVQPNQYKKR
jgi:hypothetical protein